MRHINKLLCGLLLAALTILAAPSPATARFLSPDTWDPWLAGVDINRYAYSGNDPINGSDPGGHMGGAPGWAHSSLEDALHEQRNAEAERKENSAEWNEAYRRGLESAINGAYEEAQRFNEEVNGVAPWTPFERNWQPKSPRQEGAFALGRLTVNLGPGLIAALGAKLAAAPAPKITEKYKRPNNATTKEQRKFIQGKPCSNCGGVAPKQYANHKNPLVKEYYETGKIDMAKMREIDSVDSHCPQCSFRQGAELARYSREMARRFGLDVN